MYFVSSETTMILSIDTVTFSSHNVYLRFVVNCLFNYVINAIDMAIEQISPWYRTLDSSTLYAP